MVSYAYTTRAGARAAAEHAVAGDPDAEAAVAAVVRRADADRRDAPRRRRKRAKGEAAPDEAARRRRRRTRTASSPRSPRRPCRRSSPRRRRRGTMRTTRRSRSRTTTTSPRPRSEAAFQDDADPGPAEAAVIPPPEESGRRRATRCAERVRRRRLRARLRPRPAIRRDIIVKLPNMLKPRQSAPPPPPKELGEYHLPGWDCLDDAEHGYAESQESFVREQAALLEQALKEFDIDAHVVEIDTGPVITMYEICARPGHQGVGDQRAVQRHPAVAEGRERPHRRADPGQEHGRHRGAQRAEGEGPLQGADAARAGRDARRWRSRCSSARTPAASR